MTNHKAFAPLRRAALENHISEQVKDAAVNLVCDMITTGGPLPPAEPTKDAWRIFYSTFPRKFASQFARNWKTTVAEIAAAVGL